MPTAVPLTGNVSIDALTWGFKLDSNNWTYRFAQSVNEYFNYAQIDDFLPFNQQQQNQIFGALSNVTTFLPVTLQAAPVGFDSTFRFAQASRIDYGDAQGLHIPGGRGSAEGIPSDPEFPSYIFGDQWFVRGKYETPQFGNFQNAAGLWHEFGHTLGLKHGHATQTTNGAFHPAIPTAQNSQEYSVMTYSVYAGDDPFNGNQPNDLASVDADYPWTFMQYDIQALQYMYGANFGPSSNNTNTLYAFNATTGEMTITENFNTTPNSFGTGPSLRGKVFLTIWDGGGFDVYDFRNYSNNQSIDLRPGNWSTFSTAQLARLGTNIHAQGNIANALQYQGNPLSLIEAAWGGSGNDTITGNQAANQLAGYAGNDTLNGLTGADDMYGMAGNDTFYVDNAGDRIFEVANEGTDRVLTTVSYSLSSGAAVESLSTTDSAGKSAINLTGNEFGQTIVGNAGANVIIGGGGKDTMYGYGGNDTYYVDNAADVVMESAAVAGADKVLTSVTYALAANSAVETLSTTNNAGTAAINLTGNNFAQTITGNAGANVIDGKAGADAMFGYGGNDTYYVDNAADVVMEATGAFGNDRVLTSVSYVLAANSAVEALSAAAAAATTALNLTGNNFAQTITGNAGVNRIDGKGGADMMSGLAGNDTYYVDNAGDKIVEGAGKGTADWVASSISYALGAGVQVEIMSTTANGGTSAINLTGNEFAQTITGNAGANKLDGKAGIDTMSGLAGNDTYYVDNAGDRVFESAGQGTADWVATSVSYTLGAGVQVEILSTVLSGGTTAISLTGNEFAQTITGNAGANRIDGKGGTDIMSGLGGDDTYYVDNLGDKVVEGAGQGTADWVATSVSYILGAGAQVERLSTTNTAAAVAMGLTGNEFAQTITGNAGANIINGKAGADTLYGFGGKDTFLFDSALGSTNIDRIADYNVADDTIRLENAVFSGLAAGTLTAAAFYTGSAAHDANDRIIYNSATGALLFDQDGSGGIAARQFATLSTHLALTHADFLVI